MSGYLIHKAVEFSKISKIHLPPNISENNIWDLLKLSKYVVQPKVDGCNLVAIVRDSDVKLLSRTGTEVLSANHLKVPLSRLPTGAYLGEYVIPNQPFPVTSGSFRSKKQYPEARFYIFDALALQELSEGSNMSYSSRQHRLIPTLGLPLARVPSLPDKASVDKWMLENSELSYDGYIIRLTSGCWMPGDSGVRGEIIKVKNIHSLDLKVVKVIKTAGKVTGRDVFVLVVEYNGTELKVGAGMPHKFNNSLVDPNETNTARNKRISMNKSKFKDYEKYGHLFPDKVALIKWNTPDSLAKVIQTRIADYNQLSKAEAEAELATLRASWKENQNSEDPKLPVQGDIAEVEFLGYTPDGKLREPRFKGIRPDKVEPDA